MHTALAKSITNDAEFKRVQRAATSAEPINTSFKALDYAQFRETHNARSLRAVNLLLPQATIPDGQPLKYGQLTQATSNAAVVLPLGSNSPESDYAWQPAETLPRSIAHHTFVTRQALGTLPLAEDTIHAALLTGLEFAIDRHILTSTDINSLGLIPMAGLTATQTGTMSDVLLQAANQIETANIHAPIGVTADMAILDTASFQALRTEKDFDGGFLISPEAKDVYLWGLRVVGSSHLPPKTALVFDSQQTLVCRTTLESGIRQSDSHQDYFLRNILTVLGEVRTAVFCYNPQALCRVTLL